MSHITLDNLTKHFGGVEAVRGIDLEVREGEFLVLVGPSGCGKSTTLRMLAGLEGITDGTLSIDGDIVNDTPPKDRSIAMVFQNYALYPHMTAAENMKFGLQSTGSYSDDEVRRRLDTAAETLGITELMDRKPKHLSGGERQRVAIGRALVREPEVFLLDEPLSNLDAKLRVQMRAELLKLHRELDTTTIYVTHDQTEAMTLGDRVAVMNDGQVEQVSTPQSLYDFPNTRFVAEFVGDPAMNLVPATVQATGEDYVAVHSGFEVRLPERDGLAAAAERQVLFGVRPEDVAVAPTLDRQTAVGTFTGEVVVHEPLGESLLLHVDVGGDELQVKAEPRLDVHPGDEVELGVDPERLHLFDATSGEAVYHSTAGNQSERRPPLVE
ncbi:ABC transporter ATP-binding protein [Halorussus sp. MSC15.2]|uniref:ABC transporter ATP-binding protein n=1 Tax=Halorussus sp. MSC15.2 TaxID=2283638 RepID=UPI0013D755AD|nr:ABC transporter ATP-binding protein [Halorussus sp. MSC15.2]NEU57774.1 ABC transporter ATP-binding protein [Halorussus sp. MSC15.2]